MKRMDPRLRKLICVFWPACGFILGAISDHYRWLNFFLCYVMCIWGPCSAFVLVVYEYPILRQRSRSYLIGLVLTLVSFSTISPAFFMKALVLAGDSHLEPLADILQVVGFALFVMGFALTWLAWKLAQQKYQTEVSA